MRVAYRTMLEGIRDELNVAISSIDAGLESEETHGQVWAAAFVRTADGSRCSFTAVGDSGIEPTLDAARKKMIEMWSVPTRKLSDIAR